MRIAAFHLSDLHIEKSNDIKVTNIHKIKDVLRGIKKFDLVWIIVSGDIAFSGRKEQYDTAYKMFGTIIKEIKEEFKIRWVDVFFVPGNHDVNLTNDEGHRIIQEKIRAGVTEIDVNNDLLKQRAYRNFAKGNRCIDEDDPLCFIKEIKVNDKNIKVCMLNTAIFSTMDEDKGLHFLPHSVLEKMKKELDATINILVLHHSHHWLNDCVKNDFENTLFKNVDIVVCGHEHDMQSELINKDGSELLYLIGGELCNKGNWKTSEFYLDIIDTEKMEITSMQHVWNYQKLFYQSKKSRTYNLKSKRINKNFELDEEFVESLYSDPVNNICKNVFDYYVCPDMEEIHEYATKEKNVYREEVEIVNLIKEKNKVAIIGGENSGKSLFLKKLFETFNNQGYVSVLCDASVLKGVSIKKILPRIFRNNYIEDNGSFEQFKQMRSDKKVFLLDNIHNIQKEQIYSLLKYFEGEFSYIVYTSSESIELDMSERIKHSVDAEEYIKLRILPMYAKKRENLIERIVKIKNPSENQQELVEKISSAIKMQRKMYSMNPAFVIQFTEFYLKNFRDVFSTEGNIFSKVYESNLINRIQPVAKKLTVDKILVLLDEMAYWCFKNQKSEIGQQQVCEIISGYNETYGDEVEYVALIDACVNAGIICTATERDKYRFTDKNALSYFIARQIIRIWNEQLDNSDLEYLIKYVRYGINANIVLFITYLTDNLYLINNIIDCTLMYTENWKAIDIVNVNVPYLETMNSIASIEAPTEEDREKNSKKEKEEDEKEIQEFENNKIIVKDYFEPDVHDSENEINQILRGVSLLDITSKCLPSFEHRMKKEDKDKVVNIIFNLPGKLFYLWAQIVEKDKDDLLEFLLNEYRAVYLDPKDWESVKKEDMLGYLQRESITLLLELLNIPISNSAKDYTIRYLENYKSDEVLYLLQMMMAYGKIDLPKKFEDYIKENNSKLSKCIPEYMKLRIIRNFLIKSKKITSDRLQSMVNIYFPSRRPNKTYQKILIGREKDNKKQ